MKDKSLQLPLLLLATAALLAAASYAAQAFAPAAQAQDVGPFVVGGEAPWVSVAGTTATANENVYTVPADRIFVMTGMCIGGSYVSAPVYEVGASTTTKVIGARNGCAYFSVGTHGNFITNGNARIPFAAGTNVQLGLPAGSSFTLQGFLAQP